MKITNSVFLLLAMAVVTCGALDKKEANNLVFSKHHHLRGVGGSIENDGVMVGGAPISLKPRSLVKESALRRRLATQAQINQAITDGLAYLANIQNPANGQIGSGSYSLAHTAAAVNAFENEGHFPGGGSQYSTNVEKGLDFMFNFCQTQSIGPQLRGNPDTNGNGMGVYFYSYRSTYEMGIVMPAIVASNTPDRVVSSGQCIGMTYRQVIEDAVEWLAWAQTDSGSGRGGWYYSPSNSYADNSIAQWPVLALVAAEKWGIQAPSFVKTELNLWVNYIQNSNGGSGYRSPSSLVNVAKTGGLLVEHKYLGDTSTTTRATKAKAYINGHWNDLIYGTWNGNKGHPYAMFSVFKGLELMGIDTMSNANYPVPGGGDWWGDYAHYLVGTQRRVAGQWDFGSWSGYTSYFHRDLATAWYIMILQASVFPVSVDVTVPDYSCDDQLLTVNVDYSVQRFEADGTLEIYRDQVPHDTVTLTDFIGSQTLSLELPSETTGMHTWRAVLSLSGGGITVTAEDSDSGEVLHTPQLADIPDQVLPFEDINLDEYVTCQCQNVVWSTVGVPLGWTVAIDGSNVATVTAPVGAIDPVTITFRATITYNDGLECDAEDDVTFTPNQPPVAHPGMLYPDMYEVDEGGSVELDGTQSSDPDGDAITLYWDLDEDGTFEIEDDSTPVFSADSLDGPSKPWIFLKVCDKHDLCSEAEARVEVKNVAPSIDLMTGPVAPVEVGTEVLVEAHFTDPGTLDTHFGECDFGDDSDPTGTVDQEAMTLSASHTYVASGVFTVSCTVTDDDEGSSSADYGSNIVVSHPPDAQLTSDAYVVEEGGSVQLDGTPSHDPDPSDTITYHWDLDGDGVHEIDGDSTQDFSAAALDDGTHSVGLKVCDDHGFCDETEAMVEITNVSPNLISITGPTVPVEVGTEVLVEAHFTDLGTLDTHFGECDFGDDSDPTGTVDQEAMTLSASHTYVAAGVFTVTCSVTDDDGGSSSAVYGSDILVSHRPKAQLTSGTYVVEEGESVELDGTPSHDPDPSDTITYHWDLDGDGVHEIDGDLTQDFSATILDDGIHSVGLKVCDDHGFCDETEAMVEITNVAPSIDLMTGPVDPVEVRTEVLIQAHFTDPGALDTHTGECDFGDGSGPTGTVDQAAMVLSASHTYDAAGVYPVTCTVTDDDSGSHSVTYNYAVVYDPDGGFVTGGGTIHSPAGAYRPDKSLAGRANFGFVSKYKKGANIPIGQTNFQFKAGDLHFHSTSYDHLVVAGHKAMYKGDGTINKRGNYGFMIQAIDAKLTPSTDVDRFRIKIWDKDNSDNLVYDNDLNDGDENADLLELETTKITGGSIVIHKAKKK